MPRFIAPGTAAQDDRIGKTADRPDAPAPIARRALVVLMITVRHPLRDIAVHIVKAKGIGPIATHRHRIHRTVRTVHPVGPYMTIGQLGRIGHITVTTELRLVIAKVIATAIPGPNRVFPLRLTRQLIATPRLLVQRLNISPRIMPTHTNHRLVFLHRIVQIRPGVQSHLLRP